jgi:hypothetical protein
MMKPFPSLLVVADRGRLVAYLTADNGALRLHATTAIEEGREKLSELVTDQAGAFPNPGSVGTSAAERLPLEKELETRCIRQIAADIEKLLAEEGHPIWGFAAPPEVLAATADHLNREALGCLALRVPKDLVNAPPLEVREAFEKAAELAHA